MGHFRHDVIIVTDFEKEPVQAARQKAVELFGDLVTPIVSSPHNGFYTFFIGPDGGKEGREFSDDFDARRKQYREYLWGGTSKYQIADVEFYEVRIYEDGPPTIAHTHDREGSHDCDEKDIVF